MKNATNFRDFGGAPVKSGGRVKRGRLFRSGVLDRLTDEDLEHFHGFGIGAVCDLRSRSEQARKKNRYPNGSVPTSLAHNREDNNEAVRPASWRKLLSTPGFTEDVARKALTDVYANMYLGYAGDLASIFRYLEMPDADPILIHCSAGKDRTGFTCAMVLWALGVPMDDILADYLRTQELAPPEVILEAHGDILGHDMAEDPKALHVIAGVEESFLMTAIDAVLDHYDTIDAYLEDMADLTDKRREHIHQNLVEAQ